MSSPARVIAAPDVAITSPQLKNILFATDFSDCSAAALHYVVSIASRYASTIRVVHVVAAESEKVLSLDRKVVQQKAKAHMARFLRRHSLEGVPHEAWLAQGPIAEVLSRLIQQENIDLIALGTHGHSRPKELLLGSVAAQIVRRAGCPVLIVRLPLGPEREPGVRLQRILYATDFSPASLCALPYALSLAAKTDSHLMLLHVDRANVTADYLQEAAVEQRLMRLLPAPATRFCSIEPIIEIGPVAENVVKTAEEKDANVIIMGADGPAGTASAVAARAHCPVLAVRS